jgi:type I restriction enzyme M protein
VLEHIDFTRKVGQSKIPDIKLRQLITHFGTYRLRNEDFEFPDLLGAAYEYLIGEFADSAGKKGGEFYTPRSVVRMMVRLIKPNCKHDIYDPCCGSGGMLIAAKEYIDEHGGDGRKANLFGQEFNGTVWSIAKMNMLLHGISTADLQNDDTLAEPQHVEGGELMHFDRVLTNPPFSINWGNTEKTARQSRLGAQVPRALPLRPGAAGRQEGRPDVPAAHAGRHARRRHGRHRHAARRAVPRRRGKRHPRRHDRGRPAGSRDRRAPNLFYGTGIPACILVLRQRQNGATGQRQAGRAPGQGAVHQRRPRVLRGPGAEPPAARAHREDRHTFENSAPCRASRPSSTNATLRENDCNLNIRRYADNAPPPEPHDVRAHLVGGVPKAEVQDKAALFTAHGLNPLDAVRRARRQYFDFRPELATRQALKPAIEPTPAWWPRSRPSARLRCSGGRRTARASRRWPGKWTTPQLRRPAQRPAAQLQRRAGAGGLLDPFRCAASWPASGTTTKYDFMTLMARGAKGVADAWRTSILTALDDKASKDKPAGAQAGQVPDGRLRRGAGRAGGRKAELDSQIKAATPDKGAGGGRRRGRGWRRRAGGGRGAAQGVEEGARRAEEGDQGQEQGFAQRMNAAVDALDEAAAAALLLAILRNDMR